MLVWFALNKRTFPWRAPGFGLYPTILAELLLQRTTAAAVAAFLPVFIKQFPTWECLARADTVEIQSALRPVGLWRKRAASMKRLAEVMVEREGHFPRDRSAIEELPGIGQYMASAVLLFNFGEAEPLLDGSVARLLERYFGSRQMADIRYDPYLQELARAVVAAAPPTTMNWALLDFAASVCRQARPSCWNCPLSAGCSYARVA